MASRKPTSAPVIDDAQAARTALTLAAVDIASHDLHLVPIGARKKPAMGKGWTDTLDAAAVTQLALAQVTSGKVQGVALQLGTRSAHTTDSGTVITLALELEGYATASPEFMSEWASTADRLGAAGILDRLDSGWVEHTPSGGHRWFFNITLPDVAAWTELLDRHLPLRSRAAKRLGTTYAELLTDWSVVAPSFGKSHDTGKPWVRKAGGPASIPSLTTDELFRFVDLLGELSDIDPKLGVPTAAQLDGRTSAVRTAFNLKANDAATVALLEANGWAVTDRREHGEVVLDRAGHAEVRVGGPSRPTGSLYTFSTSALPLEGFMHAFDVFAALGVDANLKPFTSPAAAAEHARDHLGIRPRYHATLPHNRVGVTVGSVKTDVLISTILTALANAKHPTEPGLPWAVRVAVSGGVGARLVTVTGSGEVSSWTAVEHAALGLAVVQPQTFHKDAEGKVTVTYGHSLPKAVTESVMKTALTEDILPTARIITSVPTLTANGTVLTQPGLHVTEAILLAIPRKELAWWATSYGVPGTPSKEQAQAAADYLLDELLRDFPFETDGDRARALAYFLTLAARHLVPTAPGFALDGASRGTGKSKLAALPRIIMTGSPLAASIGYSKKDDEENEKRMATAALNGVYYLHVDELPRDATVTSLMLSELLTAQDGTKVVRLLGGNGQIALGWMVATVAGNNINLGADIQRRFIPIRLNYTGAGMAHERSAFKHADLEAWTRQHRPELLAALHTVLAHGLQNPVTPAETGVLGSFEAWTSVVVGAMTHITIGEQNAGRLVLEGRAAWEGEQDEEVEEWGPLMVAWHAMNKDHWVKTSDAIKGLTGARSAVDLPAVLVQEINQSPNAQAKRWGLALKSRRDTPVRVADGAIYAIGVLPNAKSGNSYRVVQLEGPTEMPAVEIAPEVAPGAVPAAVEPAPVVELVPAATAVAPAHVTCDDADTDLTAA